MLIKRLLSPNQQCLFKIQRARTIRVETSSESEEEKLSAKQKMKLIRKESMLDEEALCDLETDDLNTKEGKDLLMKHISYKHFTKAFDKRLMLGIFDAEPRLK